MLGKFLKRLFGGPEKQSIAPSQADPSKPSPSPAAQSAPQPKSAPAPKPLDDGWKNMSGNQLFSLLTGPSGASHVDDHARFEAPYLRFVDQVGSGIRLKMVLDHSERIENNRGAGVHTLIPFVLYDPDPSVASTAAMNLALMLPLEKNDAMTGVRLTIDLIMKSGMSEQRKGGALRGIVLLGDGRANTHVEKVWDSLSDEGRMELSQGFSGFALAGIIEFWVKCLEKGCVDGVFGSIVATLCKMPNLTPMPIVLDIERIFPVYSASSMPMKKLGQYSFAEYAGKIRSRLNAIAAKESEPKITPMIFQAWGK